MHRGDWVRIIEGLHQGKTGIVDKVNRTAVRLILPGRDTVYVPLSDLQVIPVPQRSSGWDG